VSADEEIKMDPSSRPRGLSGEAWREFVRSLPPVDEDFARDLTEIRKSVGPPVDGRDKQRA
jgi:hypothetical protein